MDSPLVVQRAMRSPAGSLLACVAFILTVSAITGESRQSRAMEQSGAVAGRVVSARTRQPIGDVMVFLQPSGSVQDAGALATRLATPVDADGGFELRDVPPGDYVLIAEPGPTAASHVLTRFPSRGAEPSTISIKPGATTGPLTVPLSPGAVVAGRIIDERGAPVALVPVTVEKVLPGNRRASMAGSSGHTARTDDRGEFRLFGLPSGEFRVIADPPHAAHRLAPRGVSHEDPAPFSRTYYPGAPVSSAAELVTVHAGDERGPLEFTLHRGRLASITGVVRDPQGTPVSGVNVTLHLTEGGFTRAERTVASDAAGAFRFDHVAPAAYTVGVYRSAVSPAQFGSTPVSSNDAPVTVQLAPSHTVTGQIVFEDSVDGRIGTSVRSVGAPDTLATSATATARADGSFSLPDQFGPILVRAAAPGRFLEAVLLGATDVTDTPTDFASATEPLRVVMTRRGATVSGVVSDRSGRAASASVLLFSEDPRYWHERFTTTRRAVSGPRTGYRIDGLRPGRYLVVAADPDEPLSELTPAALAAFAPGATSVVIGRDESRRIDLVLTEPQ